ncbi:MAG: sugar transferase [Vampirovibrionales bacterium]|nr:sugar transferase [Vampirovibrionales bacterium]
MSQTLVAPADLSLSNLRIPSQASAGQAPSFDANWNFEPFRIRLIFDEKSALLTFRMGQFLKRGFDFVLASLGLLIISPLLVLLALIVRLTSQGPVIYQSLRIGQDQQPFYMYKFRTMYVGAEQQRAALKKQTGQEGKLFKIVNDPRITPIGAFLRKYSLDELPQLLNVVKGDMSLVGPRPLVMDESQHFKDPYTIRFKVAPGVTGLWQVSGRSNLTFEQLCDLELHYTVNWTLWQDFKILLKTIPAVLFRKGAY